MPVSSPSQRLRFIPLCASARRQGIDEAAVCPNAQRARATRLQTSAHIFQRSKIAYRAAAYATFSRNTGTKLPSQSYLVSLARRESWNAATNLQARC
jgi:hypothetical protein